MRGRSATNFPNATHGLTGRDLLDVDDVALIEDGQLCRLAGAIPQGREDRQCCAAQVEAGFDTLGEVEAARPEPIRRIGVLDDVVARLERLD